MAESSRVLVAPLARAGARLVHLAASLEVGRRGSPPSTQSRKARSRNPAVAPCGGDEPGSAGGAAGHCSSRIALGAPAGAAERGRPPSFHERAGTAPALKLRGLGEHRRALVRRARRRSKRVASVASRPAPPTMTKNSSAFVRYEMPTANGSRISAIVARTSTYPLAPAGLPSRSRRRSPRAHGRGPADHKRDPIRSGFSDGAVRGARDGNCCSQAWCQPSGF
jgi:hypothetical protein